MSSSSAACIDAPRELVFEAFTDPTHLVQFWGPRVSSVSDCEVDLRVGGAFRVDMRGPDGSTYPCTGIYREIVPPERIVYAGKASDDHPCGGGLPPHSLVTMTFGCAKPASPSSHCIAHPSGGVGRRLPGWNDGLDRLADSMPAGPQHASSYAARRIPVPPAARR